MIIIILSIILIITGVVLYLIGKKKAKDTFKFNQMNGWEESGVITGFVGIVFLVAAIVALCIIQSSSDVEYENALHTRESLVQQMNSGDTSTELYENITEFNNSIRKHKKLKNNIFIGIYTNHKIAENIEYIDAFFTVPTPEDETTSQENVSSLSQEFKEENELVVLE